MFEIKKLPNSEVEIKGEIPYEEFALAKDAALKHLGEHLELDGFRKGHVPANVVEKNVSPMAILEEMAQLTLSKNYGKIMDEHKINAIGYPRINITKLAEGNPLGFTITVAVLPEIKLPDYTKIAKEAMAKKEVVTVTDEDMAKALTEVKTMKAKEVAKGAELAPDAPLPDLDDEYVKKLGDFKDVADFSEKVRANMLTDKEWRANEKNRLQMIEKIIEESEMSVPEVLIEAETEKIKYKIKSDIENMGLKYEDYMKHLGKTPEDMKKEWRTDAEKRAKLQLIVIEIAKAEKLSVPAEKIEAEVKKITEIYKDADPTNAKHYIESVLLNEEVFKFLEAQK